MKLLHIVATLLATVFLASSESDCPSSCKCDILGTTGIFATCQVLDPNQKFNLEIASLDLSNIHNPEGLNLTDRIFESVGLKRVASIKIVNSSLKAVDVNAFHGLRNLYSLNLTGNHLGLLEPDMFADNTHLERLSLSGNPLQYMQADPSPYEGYFLNVPSLTELDISNCGLSHLLPTMFTKLTTLIYINLAHNGIEDITSETFVPLIDLEELDLSYNKLAFLRPDVFQNNSELSVLKLRNNPLTTLSSISIRYLQHLDISQCLFKSVKKEDIEGFKHLRFLNMSGNGITNLEPDTFNSLKKLQYLDLSNNDLKGVLPDDLFINNTQLETIRLKNNPEMGALPDTGFKGEFSELYLLDVSNCGLYDLEAKTFDKMKRITFLYLNNNQLTTINPGVLTQKIVHLDLSNNRIMYLDQVSFPQNSWLRRLYLNGNPLKKLGLSNFITTPRLTKLYARNCQLKQLWDVAEDKVSPLRSLVYLNVANNQIKNLTLKDISYIERVQTLVISGNPLTCNEDFKTAMDFLIKNGVASSDATEKKHLEEIRSATNEFSVHVEPIKDDLGWKSLSESLCTGNEKVIESSKIVESRTFDPDYYSDDEGEDDPTETSATGETNPAPWDSGTWDIPYLEDEIQKQPVEHSDASLFWPIITVSVSAFAIILSLVVLAACFLRWNRQKNSYRNKISKRHAICSTSRLKRGNGSVYQQLYEEHNTPTTPVMPTRLPNDHRTYTFPEKNTEAGNAPTTATSTNNTSYLSSTFHHSNIVPESV